MFSISRITPAPYGDHYDHVEFFETKEQAEIVLKALESVNVSFNLYTIVDWNEKPRGDVLFESSKKV